MLTRCSSFPAESGSSSRRAIKSEDLLPTWNFSYRCAAAQCIIGASSSSRRSALITPRKFGDHTSLSPSPTTPYSRRASKRCSRSLNSKGRFAQCCERTRRPARNPSLHMPRARRMYAPRYTPTSRRIHSCRSLWITSFLDSPTRRREITSCTIARAARCRGTRLCRWRRRAKPRTSRCTHRQLLLPSPVRRSALIRSTSADAHQPKILLRLCGNRVHAMGV